MKTIEESYNELANANPTWVNPVLRFFDNPAFSESRFIVDLVDFEEISSIPYVRILYMRKRNASYTGPIFSVYCQLI